MLVPSRQAQDLFAGWWQVIDRLGAVPRTLVWDGEGAVGRWRARKPELTGDCRAFRGTLGVKLIICKPADPEAKGLLEAQRDSVLSIVAGLDEEAWHRSVVPSGWTPAGLVEHLGGAERHWFQGSWPAQMQSCPGMRACPPTTRRQRSSVTGPQRR